MDFLKKGQEMLNKSQNQEGQAAPAQGAPAGGEQKEDYGDKAFGFASKKAGYNTDPNTSEKITDGARGLYEKATGNKVDPKWSN